MRKLGIVVGVIVALCVVGASFGCNKAPTAPSAVTAMAAPDGVAARQAEQTKRVWIYVIDRDDIVGIPGVEISRGGDFPAFTCLDLAVCQNVDGLPLVTNDRGRAFVDLKPGQYNYDLKVAKVGCTLVDFGTGADIVTGEVTGKLEVRSSGVTQLVFYMRQ